MSSSANLSRLHELYAADIKDVVAVMVKCNTYTPSAEFLVQKLLATQPDDEEFKIAEREFVELREVRAAMKFMRMYRREYDHYEECLHGTEDDALADWKETAIGMSFYMSRSLRAEENVADPRYTACVQHADSAPRRPFDACAKTRAASPEAFLGATRWSCAGWPRNTFPCIWCFCSSV
jgi:hypothetical protein